MANKFQTYAEWKEAQKSSGSETASYRQFETYAQWKARQQTPEERAKYYQASGMDDFRKDFRTYASYGIVKDTANRQWAKNIQKQRDYFRRYASHFSQEQLTAFNEELDLYESIVNQRAEYAKLQPQIQEYQASQAAYQNYTEQRETMYGEEGLRADTQLYKNPNAMAALAQNGDPKAQELVRKRYASLGKLYGDEALGYQQAVDTQRETSGQIRELDKQIEALDANIETAEYYLNDGKTMYAEGGREEELRHVAAWKQERDALVKQRDTLAAKNAEATKIVDGGTPISNTYAAYAVSEQEYKKAKSDYNSANLATENVIHNIMNLFYGTAEYDEYVAAKEKDEKEAALEHRAPTYDNLIALFRSSDYTDASIEGMIAELPAAFEKREKAWKVLMERETLLRVKAQKNNDAWEYEMYRAMGDKNFAKLSAPDEEKKPDGELGDIYQRLIAGKSQHYDDFAFTVREKIDGKIKEKTLEGNELANISDAEKALFFYYCNSGEYEKAELLIYSIADSLKYRTGVEYAENVDYPVLREIAALSWGMKKGVEGLLYGIGSLVTPLDAPDVSSEEYASGELYEKHKGSLTGFAIGASENIGNMVPSIAGYAINPAVGLTSTFFNARGNAYVEAKRNGYSEGQAWVYSTLVGASEAGLEKLLGGLGGMAKGLVPEKLSSMMPKVNGIVGKLCKEIPLNLLSEITEENIQNYLEPAFKMLVGAELEYDAPGYEDFVETTIVTAISTLFFSIARTPGMVKQERFNRQVGKWADAAMRAEKGSEIYQEGEKLRKMLDSGEDITVEYMRGISERIGVEKFASVGMSAETAKIIDNAKGWIGEIDPEFFMPENAETDVEDTIEAYLEEAQTASEENNPKKLIEASASVVKMLDAAKVNLDNALAQNLIDQDTYSRVQQRIEEARLGAKEILDLYLNPGTKTVGQATDIEGEMPEDSLGVKAYLDAGASEAEAMSAGEILDGILRGEITSETISNNKIKKLLANEEYGRNAISAALGVEVTREATASKQISAVRAAIAQYETSAAQRQQESVAGAVVQQNEIEELQVKEEKQSGTEISDDSGERDAGMGAGEQAGAVEEGTGRQVNGGTGKTEADILRDVKNDSRAQSAKEIGVRNGSEEKSVYVLTDEEIEQSESWKRVKKAAESSGARAVLYAGDLKVHNKTTGEYSKVEGIRQEGKNGEIVYYIKADRKTRNAEKIYKHEYFHELVSKTPEMWSDLVTALYEQYSEREIVAMADRYAEAFDGIYGQITEDMSEEAAKEIAIRYLEEMFADAYADIQRARVKTSAAKRVLASQTDAVQRAEQTKRATRDTRGAPESRFSFAGKLSKNADMEALALAKEMQGQDVDRETIFRETGWFIGADGKWRYEIDDSKARYKKGGDAQFLIDHPKYAEYQDLMAKALFGQLTKQEEIRLKELDEIWGREYARLSDRVKNGNATLENILQHEELFSAYPQLRDVKVEFAKMEGGEKGKYDRKNNTITISEELKNRPVTTLLHEIQHAIQKIEGFERGASQEYWNNRMQNGFSKKWDTGAEMTPTELYRNTAGEIEARDAAARMDMTAEQRRNTFPNIGDENTVFAEDESDGSGWVRENDYDPEAATIKQQIDNSKDLLNGMQIVASATVPENLSNKSSAAKWAEDILKRYGYKVDRKGYGEIYFGKKDIDKALRYADTPEERAALAVLPQVIKRGIEAGNHNNHKQREKQTVTFAAPVELNGIRGNMAVVVNRRGSHFYAHRIVMPDGTIFKFSNKKTDAARELSRGVTVSGSLADTTSAASDTRVADKENVVKDKFSFDDEDYMLAVEAGDMEAAQKMVEEAAQAAMPNTKILDDDGNLLMVYHGSDAKFTEFDMSKGRSNMNIQGAFFSPWELDAQGYGENIGRFYLNITNPASESMAYKALNMFKGQNDAGIKAQRHLERLGYDGVNNGNEEYIAFYPEQAKSADPVTYDDNGKIIPISERFDTGRRDIRYSIDEAYEESIDDWDKAGRPEGENFILGSTGDVLQGLGAIESDIYMQGDKIQKIILDHPEMTLEEIKKIPQILEDPVLILKSRNVGRANLANTRLVIFGTVKAQNGMPVLCVLDLRPSEGRLLIDDMQKVSSAYVKDNDPVGYISKSDVLYADKKRTNQLLRWVGFQMPTELLRHGSLGSITYDGNIVNLSGEKFSDVVRTSERERFSAVEDDADLKSKYTDTPSSLLQNGSDLEARVFVHDAGGGGHWEKYIPDEESARKMQEDDEPEGMAHADEEIEDYHALAKEQKMRRAELAKESTLKSRIKASENAIAGQQAGKAALRSIGALSEAAEKKINQRVELIRETMQIDREALKKKQQARESEERKKKQEKQQTEIKDQKAKIATKELRQGLLNLFSVKAGKRAELADQINRYADELIRSGTLTNESRRALFEMLYENGEEVIQPDEYRSNIRSAVKNGRIYVPDSVREEFGEAWDAVQKKAWESKLYFTNDKADAGIDAWTKELASVFGEQFDRTKDLKTQLETILELAEEGKQESITIEEMMRRNSEEYGWSIEEQMDELERKVDRMLETFAEKADLEIRLRRESTKKLLEDQEYFRRKIETMRRERMENEARNQVLKRMDRLKRYEKKASPKFKEMINDAIKDIDTLARRFSPRGIEDIQSLLDDYLQMKEDLGEGFITSNEIEDRLQRLKKMHIDDMGIEEVRALGEALTGMITQIQNQNQLLSTARREKISIFAGRVQREIEATKGRKHGGKLQNYMQSHLDAKRFFGMISGFSGGATEELSKGLSNAEERTRQFQLRAIRIFDSFMADKNNRKWLKTAAGKDAVWEKVDVKGSISNISGVERPVHEIEITPMMKISLLMHSRNDDNLRHIGYYIEDGEGGYELVGGGVTIPNKKLYQKGKMKEAYAKGDVVVIPPEVVNRIAKSCTEQERAFAELLTKYFDGLAKDSINEVSLIVDGWERAAVQYYFPVQSDRAFIVTDNELIKQDASLTSRGFLKERTHKGQNPVYLMDASDVLFRSIDQVSKYYGMTLAIRDVNAVLNSTYYLTDKEKGKRNKKTGEKGLLRKTKEQEGWGSIEFGSVRKTLEEKWGTSATEYINKLIADLQKSERSGDALSGFLEMLRGNYARAVISFNPSSVLKQMSSYPVAMAYLDADSLAYGLTREHWKNAKEAVRNLEKYSAVYWYRNQGNATMELRDAMAKKQLGEGIPLGFGWTQKMDSAVTRRLLAACEYQVKKDMKLTPGTQEEIEDGTDAYWSEVAKLFNKVVLNTQSNTSMMERPELTRANPSNISRFLTMFRTDAFQQYNLLVEAMGRLRYARDAVKANDSAENRARLKEARKFARKSVTGIIVGQTMVALITSLLSWARFRDKEYYDDEGNFDWGAFLLSAGDDFAEGFAGFIMGGDMLWSAASAMVRGDKWYGPEISSLETITDMTNSVINLWNEMKDGNYRGTIGVAHDIAVSAGTAFGLPVGNIEKYLLAAAKWIAPEFAEKYENLWEEKTKASLSRESPRLIEEAVGQIMENRTENTSDEAKEEIARLYKNGMTSAVPNAIPTKISYTDGNGESFEVSLNGPQRERFRKVWKETVSGTINEVIASEEYEKADDEGKAALIKRLYEYAGEIAKNAVEPRRELDKWVQQGENAVSYGIPLSEYICFRELLSGVDGKDKDGKSVDGLKAQRSVDILEAMGWTDQQEENIYIDVIASDSAKETEKALRKAGMTWEQANDIVSMVGKKKDRMTAISKMNIGENVKRSAMMVYASDKEKKVLKAAGVFGVKMAWYMEVLNNADEDGSGKVSGDEAQKYIFGMDLTWMEKAHLWQMVTDGKEGKNNPFSTYAGEEFWMEAHKDEG